MAKWAVLIVAVAAIFPFRTAAGSPQSGKTNVNDLQCSTLVGKSVTPLNFDDVASKFPAIEPKGEFESSAEYNARRANAYKDAPHRTLVMIDFDRNFIKYDADKQKLSVFSGAFPSGGFYFGAAIEGTDLDPGPNSYDYASFVRVSSEVVSSSTYMASNAFGVQTEVTDIQSKTKVIFDRPLRDHPDNELFVNASIGDEIIGTLSLPPGEAKRLKPKLAAALLFQTKKPYFAIGKQGYHTPTVKELWHVTETYNVLFADIQCGLLLDEKNRVLLTFQRQ